MKKDSSTESWGKIEMTHEWIQLAQTNPHRMHFIMPYTFEKLGDVAGKVILDLGCGGGGTQGNWHEKAQPLPLSIAPSTL